MPKKRDPKLIKLVIEGVIKYQFYDIPFIYKQLKDKINYRTFLRIIHHLEDKKILFTTKKAGGRKKGVYLQIYSIYELRAKEYLKELREDGFQIQ